MVNTWDLVPQKAGEAGSARGLKRGWTNSQTTGPPTDTGMASRDQTSTKQPWVVGGAVEVATLPPLPKHQSLFSWKEAEDWAGLTTCLTQWAQGYKHRVLWRRTSGDPSKRFKKRNKNKILKIHLKDFPANQIFAKPWNIFQCWCVNSVF